MRHERMTRHPLSFWVTLLLGLALSVPSIADNRPLPLSERQRGHLRSVYRDAAARPGTPMTLDMSKSNHRRFLRRQLREAGYLERGRAENLRQAGSRLQEHHRARVPNQAITLHQKQEFGVFHPSAFITQLSRVGRSEYYAAATASIPDAVQNLLLLQLFDSNTWQPIGKLAVVEEWLNDRVSISATGHSLSGDVTAVYTVIYHAVGEELAKRPVVQVQFKSIDRPVRRSKDFLSLQGVSGFNIVQPCPKDTSLSACKSGTVQPGTGKRTLICQNRGPEHGFTCDQRFENTPCDGFDNECNDRLLDVKGGVTLDDNLPQDWASNLQSTLYITTSGTCKVKISPVSFTGTAGNNTVYWDWSNQYFKNPCLGLTRDADFHMEFTVKTSSSVKITIRGDNTCVPALSSDSAVACIYPLNYAWGCLAKGTAVVMVDGSLKNVEDILVGEQVLSNTDGGVLTVVNTYRGRESLPLLAVEDDRGNRLTMTEAHPTVTERGVLLARQLVVGDTVTTADGPAKIVSITEVEHEVDVTVFNLDLGDEGEAVGEDGTTFFAGGILVGDNQMQGRYEELARTVSPDKISPLWRQDYQRWVESRKPAGP